MLKPVEGGVGGTGGGGGVGAGAGVGEIVIGGVVPLPTSSPPHPARLYRIALNARALNFVEQFLLRDIKALSQINFYFQKCDLQMWMYYGCHPI